LVSEPSGWKHGYGRILFRIAKWKHGYVRILFRIAKWKHGYMSIHQRQRAKDNNGISVRSRNGSACLNSTSTEERITAVSTDGKPNCRREWVSDWPDPPIFERHEIRA
jgi:hypothetical protein